MANTHFHEYVQNKMASSITANFEDLLAYLAAAVCLIFCLYLQAAKVQGHVAVWSLENARVR